MKRIRLCKRCSYFFPDEEPKCPDCESEIPDSYLEERYIFDKLDEFKKLHPEAYRVLTLFGALLKR